MQGVLQEMINPDTVASLCFLADVLECTNTPNLLAKCPFASAQEHKKIKNLEKEMYIFQWMQTFSFDVMLQVWCQDLTLRAEHPDVTKMLFLATLIPPSTSEIERTFSLMKLLCTRLRILLTQASLVHCMRISKYRTLSSKDYKDILKHWLRADETKTKKEEPISFEKVKP